MPLTDAQLALVSLKCSTCQFEGTPTLIRTQPTSSKDATQLGAYCGRCKRFLTWVKQSTQWLTLERDQSAVSVVPAPGALPVVPRDVTLNAQITGMDGPHNPYTPGSGNAFAWDQGYRAANPPTQDELFVNAITLMGHACYDNAEAVGFHDSGERSVLELAMLVVTELAELSEAARKGTLDHPSEHIPEFTQAQEEWADVLVRVFDHSLEMHIDPKRLGQAFVAKLAYNRTRGYRHGGKTI